MKKWLSAVAAVVMCASVLSAAGAPEWTSGQSRKYPAESYIVGVGLGKDLETARTAARAEIAKTFKARIVQSAQDTNSERQLRDGGTSKDSSFSESAQSVTISTEQELAGTEVPETWFDKKGKTHYALAVLQKQKLRVALAGELSDLEENIQSHLALSRKSTSTIDKIRALSSALSLWDRKDEVAARKRVVDPVAAPDLVSGSSRADLEKERNAAMRSIIFSVETACDVPALKEIVSDRISKLGFGIVTGEVKDAVKSDTTLITVKCSAQVEPFDRGNPQWKFYSWRSGADISEAGSGGMSFASIAKQGQSAALSEETAKKKAAVDAVQALGLAVAEQISRDILGKMK